MKIVVAQHKGGVGKTTLAVHVAGVLTNELDKVLLIDCDSQADAFRFFTKTKPNSSMELQEGMDEIDVLWNYKREKLSKKQRFEEYEHIIVDIDTRVQNALQVITEIEPDIIFIPVDRQKLSVEHLGEVLSLIARNEGIINYPTRVKIVQMGSQHNLDDRLKTLQNIPKYLSYGFSIPYLDEFDDPLNNGKYIWNYSTEMDIKTIFQGVIYG